MQRRRAIGIAFAVAGILVALGPASAQEETTGPSADDLAKQSQNPVGTLISLPFQNNTNFGVGPGDDVQNILNIQPVVPLNLGKLNLINRIILPVVYQPEFVPGEGSTFGLGDTSYTAFFSPAQPGKFIWGVGPSFTLPTATDDALGLDQWAAGPGFVGLVMPGPWVVGALVQNVWGLGSDDDIDVNRLLFQYFLNYNLPSGWYFSSAPIITADWEADSGNRWTVPLGGGFGKVYRIGKRPVNAGVQAYYNVEKPEFAADWSIRIQMTLLFPR
jgi:hypothetical protein